MPTNPADRVDSYFICATPRTGSSLLLGLLESTGVAGRPQAYFRSPDEPLWADRWQLSRTAGGGFDYADYVRAALAGGRTENGVFGAKLMWGTLDEVVGKLAARHPDLAGDQVALLNRAFGRTRFVLLRRDDVLAQAVSWLRAEQTGTWFVGGNGEIGGNAGDGRPPRFDPDQIRHFIGKIREHNAAWEAWFASWGIRPHVVRYEELDADMVATTHRILDFLGLDVPEGCTITARHQRQTDELNRLWIERYGAAMDQSRPVVYLLVGLPGSGKSTYAEALESTGVVRLSVDDAVQARHGRLGKDYPADRHMSLLGPVVEDVRRQLVDLVRTGRSVVLDHGLGQRRERDEYKQLVESLGAEWRLLYFRVDQAELQRRLVTRNEDPRFGVISPETLDWMAAVSEAPHGEGEEVIASI
ncbi:Stf0 family sulfotransferase [Micromonospora sp. IBHARD004]|uniref:Stf0 family sulfotransferase n=1 Tax=Micromonospora sp. IBHARD004 TaxID=3457764 RepID=UPI004058CFCD